MRIKTVFGVGCTLSLIVSISSFSPALANEVDNSPEGIASFIEAVAPASGDPLPLTGNGNGSYTSDSSQAQLPINPADPLVIGGNSSSPLEVSLPENLNLNAGFQTNNGTFLHKSGDGTTDVASQVFEDGSVRVQTILKSPNDSHEFEYKLGGGYSPAVAEDGTLWAISFGEDESFNAYEVQPAWAKDANGADVRTEYEVRDNSIVQVVYPDQATVYPVVADPTWLWYNAAYGAGFSKKETRNLASYTTVGAFCNATPAGPIRVACFVSFGYYHLQATAAKNANGCVFIAAVPAPIALRWLSNQCK